jgi:hypothetical protein
MLQQLKKFFPLPAVAVYIRTITKTQQNYLGYTRGASQY